MQINTNFFNLKCNYLFSETAKKVENFKKNHNNIDIINLGIGDVTIPISNIIGESMINAVKDLEHKDTFHGYGNETGYLFLKEAIAKFYYNNYKINLSIDDIFVSDGAKSDLGNILDIISVDNIVLIPDPVYPAYIDANIIDGRKINFVNATYENNFLAQPDFEKKSDIIYICSPNNPTGAVYDKQLLNKWVEYALFCNAIIIFDSAYKSFIQDNSLPRSIYEIENAKKCAIEICSFSKDASFTGIRCGYTIIPQELLIDNNNLNALYKRRQASKYNGTSYISQRGAEAALTQGSDFVKKNIKYYLNNAKLLSTCLKEYNYYYVGGVNSPYIWFDCKKDSWQFFDELLKFANIVGTPGAGFGNNGKNYFRLSAFNDLETIKIAVNKLKNFFENNF